MSGYKGRKGAGEQCRTLAADINAPGPAFCRAGPNGTNIPKRSSQTPVASYFVTGIGSDARETAVSAALLRHWRREGLAIAALKPIMCGFDPADPTESSAGQLLAAMGAPLDPQGLDLISPWRFRAALSPCMAATEEGGTIPYDKLVATCRAVIGMMPPDGRLIIEGVSGIFACLDEQRTTLDWMQALGIPILLVTGHPAEVVNLASAAATAMAARSLKPTAVVVSDTDIGAAPVAEAVAQIAQNWPNTPVLTLGRSAAPSEVAEAAADIEAAGCQS